MSVLRMHLSFSARNYSECRCVSCWEFISVCRDSFSHAQFCLPVLMFSAQVIDFLCGDAIIPTYLPTNQPTNRQRCVQRLPGRVPSASNHQSRVVVVSGPNSHRRVSNSKNTQPLVFVWENFVFLPSLTSRNRKKLKFQGRRRLLQTTLLLLSSAPLEWTMCVVSRYVLLSVLLVH